ncbi:MAG TPA: carboxylating nicotinate-nucleotide diphosphorylase [Candidatus Nitrosopelagicus sp.]|nr:carboxylating nicotinate-nucleotide diphosphorylase [Candidatus Nitrosopelagicus sp.]
MSFNAQRELKRFLAEDIGKGDLTSKLLGQKEITAEIITRQDTIVAGTNFAKQIFSLNGCSVKIVTNDGKKAKANQSILRIKGKAYSILACERTALNLLSRMCGIATNTNHLVSIIKKNKSKSNLFATRKTAPGLRQFDKIAVEIGGGRKHRMSLDESILIKDNHISVEPLETLIQKAKKTRKKIEVEVENQNDAILVAQLGVTIIMLDNFTPKDIKKTIKKMKELKLLKYVKLEASGRINEKNIAQYAKTGVDMISVGEITNSSLGIDLSLEIN